MAKEGFPMKENRRDETPEEELERIRRKFIEDEAKKPKKRDESPEEELDRLRKKHTASGDPSVTIEDPFRR